MLVRVKKPRIELSIHGKRSMELLDWLRKKYEVTVISTDDTGELIPIEETAYWKKMQQNRVGNLLAGARLKAGLTQAQLAEKLGIRQKMISDYERGRRTLSPDMAKRFSSGLGIKPERLTASIR